MLILGFSIIINCILFLLMKNNKNVILAYVLVFVLLFSIGQNVYAKYIINEDMDIQGKSSEFYFDVTSNEEDIVKFVNNKAEFDFSLKNNDDINFNDYNITYEISLLNNNKYTFLVDGKSPTDGILTLTLNGSQIINENKVIEIIPKENVALQLSEDLEIKINVISPYVKEYLFPVTIVENKEFAYDYSGTMDIFIAPMTGKYKIELWGAQGGGFTGYDGGTGGYVSGEIELVKGKQLFVNVGGKGNGYDEQHVVFEGGYNGGGNVMTEIASEIGLASTGGGATDIRLTSGVWNDFQSLKSRIMVASGGGGSDYYADSYVGYGGPGGGLSGYDGYADSTEHIGIGASQVKGGVDLGLTEYSNLVGGFGYGGSYANDVGSNAGMGGSGYYGGSAGYHYRAGGGGGSSFISGHNGCDAILENSTKDNIIHSGTSVHYSGYSFTNTVMIDGKGYTWKSEKGDLIGMPTYDGTTTMIGNTGNGYAKITFLEAVDNPDVAFDSLDVFRKIERKDCEGYNTTHGTYDDIYAGNSDELQYNADGSLVFDEDNPILYMELDESKATLFDKAYSLYITFKANTNQEGADGKFGGTIASIGDGVNKYKSWVSIYKNYLHIYSYYEGGSKSQLNSALTETGFISFDISKYSNKIINLQITATKTGTTKVYINGELQKSFNSGGADIATTHVTIGDLRPLRNLKFQGTIYDFSMYNMELTEEQVKNNYNYAKNNWMTE